MVSLVALTGTNRLVSFESDSIGTTTSVAVTGLRNNGKLIGIDTRPADGLIYGVTNRDDIYTIDPDTGEATFVSQLNMSFNSGKVSGFDFNPVADRLRLVGEDEQNFRINVDTGEVALDTSLAFAGENGRDPRVTAAAYTNAIANAESTQLYDIDTSNDTLLIQDPANDGTLTTVGSLGINFGGAGGFDIVSTDSDENTAYAVSNNRLFTVDLGTGVAAEVGTVGFTPEGGGDNDFRGLTVRADAAPDPDPMPDPMPSPDAAGSLFLGLTDDDKLVSFSSDSPGQTRTTAIVGLDAPLLGIDTRPANGLVYGITSANTIYTINPNTGIATRVSQLDISFEGTTVSGFDFNPVADRLRLVGDNDQDFRINVDTGVVTVDGDLAYAEGDANFGVNPRVTAAAYTKAIANPNITQLYNIDADLDVLVLQDPPNDGTLITVGDLGVDIEDLAGFDIIAPTEGDNSAFAVADSMLYSIDLSTGAATSLGTIGSDGDSDDDSDSDSDDDSDSDRSIELKGLATVDRSTIVSPIASNSRFLALSTGNRIDSFNPGNPKAVRSIDVTGLDSDTEALIGIDTRPANGLVYGVTDANKIYTIDPNSGAATLVSTLDIPFDATTISGVDFNPVADRLRLVGDNDQNFRINVDSGEVALDITLTYADGDANSGADPQITAAAYTNSVAPTPSSTQLYDIDTDLDILVQQTPANDGSLETVGELGVDFGDLAGFDIISSEEGSSTAFAVSGSTLYSIDLVTGAASSLGNVGSEASTYLGLATLSNEAIDPTVISIDADDSGLVSRAAYDVTAANRVNASLGNNPAVESEAEFDNYVGFYEVANANGGIDTNSDGTVDLNAGDDGYAAAAISRRLDNFVIRTGGNPNNDTSDDSFNPLLLSGGKFYAPFIIANLSDDTPEDFLTNNPNNEAAARRDDQVAYFSFVEANPDGAIHLKSLGSSASGSTTFGFEDLPSNLGISDNDFNDAVFQVDFTVV